MSSNLDVFGNLNKYLEGGEFTKELLRKQILRCYWLLGCDDTINYEYESGADNSQVAIEVSPHVSPRKTKALKPNESVDLTDDSFEFTPRKRSRRAADNIEASVTIEIGFDGTPKELNNNKKDATASEDSVELATPEPRRGRGRPKKASNPASASEKVIPEPKKGRGRPKTQKKMSLKQALALAKAPIPELNFTPPASLQSRSRRLYEPPACSSSGTDAVDLTGDVFLTDKHSSAPLFQKQTTAEAVNAAENIEDEFDPDKLNIKIKYKRKIRGITHRRYQRYYDLFKTVGEQENIPIRNIFLFDGEKRIHHDDTPHSTDYNITKILVCRVMETQAEGDFQQAIKKDQIDLKLQSDKWKRPVVVRMSKVDDFKVSLVRVFGSSK